MTKQINPNLCCPICGSTRVKNSILMKWYLRLRDYHKLFHCLNCNHFFRLPHIDQDINIGNKWELKNGNVKYAGYTGSLNKKLPDHLIQRFSDIPADKTILDFGSGDGAVVNYLRGIGFSAYGVDQEPQRTRFLDAKPFVYSDLSLISCEFDVLHMNHVVEHLNDPIRTVVRILNHMKCNSLVMIEVPNELRSLSAIVKMLFLRRSNSATSLYEHQHYFSTKSLGVFCISCGLEILETSTPFRIKSGLRGVFDRIAAKFAAGDIIYILSSYNVCKRNVVN